MATIDSTAREELLRPFPRITLRMVLLIIGTLLLFAWASQGTRFSIGELIAGMPAMANLIARMFPPRFEWSTTDLFSAVTGPGWSYPTIIPYILETVQMAIIGTTGAVILSLVFALLAARNTTPHPLIYQVTRFFLNTIRSIPEIIFALLFVAAVGLGPFGGVLALALGAVGSTAKVFAESIESIDPQQVLAVRATGAAPLQVFNYAVIPQALPVMASYTILLFEHNVRAATILGIVGAGGVGFILQKYLALFQYRELMGAVIIIVVVVTLIDRLSDYLRKKII